MSLSTLHMRVESNGGREREHTMPNSSRSLIVALLVVQAGAVQPRGFFPTMFVRTSMLFFRTSLSCSSLKVDTNSCV